MLTTPLLKLKFYFIDAIVTGAGFGKIPFAPGTWGSAVGVLIFFAINHSIHLTRLNSFFLNFFVALLLALVAFFAIESYESHHHIHDDPKIVVDEIAGQYLALCFFDLSWKSLLLAFFLFRVFDILKPGPIGWADRKLAGAWGTLTDDLLGGLAAAATLGIFYLVAGKL